MEIFNNSIILFGLSILLGVLAFCIGYGIYHFIKIKNEKLKTNKELDFGGKVFCEYCLYYIYDEISLLNNHLCLHPSNIEPTFLRPLGKTKDTPMVLNEKNDCKLYEKK